ncbi:hypothetical protein [Nannocystis pusilla]|uniref:Cohesin domain-containing protein n=1 Tax=Nannocystis pusilla TaxID=889268 RepID=A0ABS7U379_9BACT|nr:hypothetical protein [Nannocystis pusilla]MBZ5714918.1 hypothetical protein [Nannocystis pusilla]
MPTISVTEATTINLTATLVSNALQVTYQSQTFTLIVDTFYQAGTVQVSISDFTVAGVTYAVFAYSVGAGVNPWPKSGSISSTSFAVPAVDLSTELDFVVVAIKPDGTSVLHALDPKIRVIRRA